MHNSAFPGKISIEFNGSTGRQRITNDRILSTAATSIYNPTVVQSMFSVHTYKPRCSAVATHEPTNHGSIFVVLHRYRGALCSTPMLAGSIHSIDKKRFKVICLILFFSDNAIFSVICHGTEAPVFILFPGKRNRKSFVPSQKAYSGYKGLTHA